MRDWGIRNIFKAQKVSNVSYILFLAKPDMYSGALKKGSLFSYQYRVLP